MQREESKIFKAFFCATRRSRKNLSAMAAAYVVKDAACDMGSCTRSPAERLTLALVYYSISSLRVKRDSIDKLR